MAPQSETYADEGEQRWPLVTNPAARRVLTAVYEVIPHAQPPLPLDRLRRAPPYASPAGAAIRQRLRGSGIAQAIAGGPDLLPDFYDYLPPLWRPAARLFKHRNQAQYAVHVLRNLKWYLSPPTAVRPPGSIASSIVYTVIITLALAALIFIGFYLAFSGLYEPDFIGMLAMLLLIGVMLLLSRHWLLSTFTRHLDKRTTSDVSAVEYFLYLLESYSDADSSTDKRSPLALAEAQSIPGADVPRASGATDVTGIKTRQAD